MIKSGARIALWVLNGIGVAAVVAGLYYGIYYSSEILIQDKKSTALIPEGKYIINVLADEYENFLKEKGQNLEEEKIRLLSEKEIAKSRNEQKQIEDKLRQIESEKKNVDTEFSRNEQQRKEIEKNLKNTQENLEKTREDIARLNQDNLNLSVKNEAMANYLRDYFGSIKNGFGDIYRKNPKKLSEIESGFSNDNGRNFIAGEFKILNSVAVSNNIIDELKKENADLKNSLNTITNESRNEKDRKIADLTGENEDLKNAVRMLSNSINSDKDRKIAGLIKENADLKNSLKTAAENDSVITALTKENGELKIKLENHAGKNNGPSLNADIPLLSAGKDYNDPLVNKGDIIATAKNQLIITTGEGNPVKTVKVVPEDYGLTRPVISDNIIYVGSDNGGIYAYKTTGELLWKMKAGKEIYGASPAADSGLVAVPSLDEGITIYDSKGKLLSKINETDPIFSAPIFIRNGKFLVYVSQIGDIVSYDIKNKAKTWDKNYNDIPIDSFPYPLTGDDNIIIALSSSGKVIAVKASDGSLAWKADFPEIKDTSINPRFVSGKLIMAGSSSKSVIIVVNALNGNVELRSEFLNGKLKAPFINGDSIYFGTDNGNIYSYKLK